MIYLSTGLLEKKSTSSIINNLENLNIKNLELSSGPYEKEINNFISRKISYYISEKIKGKNEALLILIKINHLEENCLSKCMKNQVQGPV